MRLIIAALLWMAPLAFLTPDAAAFDQKPKARPKMQRKGTSQNLAPKSGTRNARPTRAQANALERWRKMSPKQRQHYVQQLPPARRREFQQRMNRLQNLPPQQRQRLQRNYQQFSEMSPREQNDFRGLYQRFNKMPADRRPMLMNEYRKLRKLSPGERKSRLQSDAFQDRFRPGEKKLLQDLSKTMPDVE
jgi:uncharacterized protein DUF3106